MSETTERQSQSSLDLARASYRAIPLYSPDRTPCRIDLSDNTNLFGVPPAALGVLRGAETSRITRYPSVYANTLKQAIADYVGVDETCIVTGCGSDDILDNAIRAFTERGDRIAMPDPSFLMIPLFAKVNGVDVQAVPLRENLEIDADALLAAQAAITYICTPNNPTGACVSYAALARVLREARGLVIVDEAYAEYASSSHTADAPRNPRQLSTRTFSKALGLAGLRIGFGVGAPELVKEVEKSRGPYKVNALAEAAAVAALTSDRAWIADKVEEVKEIRSRFGATLREIGLSPLPSEANFLLAPVADAARTSAAMRARGVAVRPFAGLTGIGDALRISLGPWHMMEEAAAALQAALR